MSVTTSSASHVFCEGKVNSYDTALLNRLLAGSGPHIVPSRGKSGLNSFIEGYLSSFVQQTPFLAFRDRDFDFTPPETPGLLRISDSKPVFATYRTCLENYLIDARLFHDYWEAMSIGPRWRFGMPPSLGDIQDQLETSAKQILEYQAVRWALADLKPRKGWPSIGTTWLSKKGELPSSLVYQDCLNEARPLVTSFPSDISVNKLEERAEHHRQIFLTTEFYLASRYLIWFNGNDLLQAVSRNLIPPLGGSGYTDWAIEKFDLNDHPNLLELKHYIEKLSLGGSNL